MTRRASNILAVTIGLNMVVFGISQIARPAGWHRYIPAWLDRLLPVSKSVAMRTHGTGNILLGLALMSATGLKYTSIAAASWWAFVLPFCARVSWRAGVRDASILSALIALRLLAQDKPR